MIPAEAQLSVRFRAAAISPLSIQHGSAARLVGVGPE
jgi:hypothetical protein